MKGKSVRSLAAVALLIAACASSGTMDGWLKAQDQGGGHVVFTFKSEVTGTGGTMTAVLPDGETYSGKYVQITSTTTEDALAPMFQPWDPYWNSWGPYGTPWYAGAGYTTFRRNYSGKIVATLLSSKGGSMRCRFQVSDPPQGLSSGGTGECQLATGGTIDVSF